MQSRQYLIRLNCIPTTIALRVYADRSVEAGTLEGGEFLTVPFERPGVYLSERHRITDLLKTARGLGYSVEKSWL